jgi:WD40 repeat protein
LESVFTLEFSPNGRFLAAGGAIDIEKVHGGDVWVWDLDSPDNAPLVFRGDLRYVSHLNFSPDSQRLAVCGNDSHAEIRDVQHGERLVVLAGHTSVVQCIKYSPDGRYIVTASEDGTAKVWDAESGLELLSYQVPGQNIVEMACFTPDSRRVVTAGEDNFYRLLAFQDFDELLDIVRKRATRDWTAEERRRYLEK